MAFGVKTKNIKTQNSYTIESFFGAIKDKKAGYQVTRMFHKEFENEEPSVDYLLTQSAPLPINLTPNHVFRIVNVNA